MRQELFGPQELRTSEDQVGGANRWVGCYVYLLNATCYFGGYFLGCALNRFTYSIWLINIVPRH